MAKYKLDLATGKWVDDTLNPGVFPYSINDAQGNEYASHTQVYRLALVGVGSSVAYYLNALGAPYVAPQPGSKRTKPPPEARRIKPGVLFGTDDAWDVSERGDGFINHEVHEIGQWGDEVPAFSPDYMERAEFAAQNRDVFDRAVGVDRIRKVVTRIKAFGDIYKVYTDARFYLAAKVVIGMGAGPHQRPRTMKVYEGAWPRVLDLDQFMRRYPREADLGGKHVIVNGANAGIDAVERAASLGATVTWFIGSTSPVILPGNRLEHAPELAKKAVSVGYDVQIVADDDDTLRVSFTPRNKPKATLNAHLYVYAVGQDPMAAGAVGDVLITEGNIPWTDLEPIYDINQVFGEPYETVVGLQRKKTTSDSGLQIIGAAASSMAAVVEGRKPRIGHNFAEQFTRPPPVGGSVEQRKAHAQQTKLITKAEEHLRDKTVVQSFNAAVRQDIGSVVLTAQLVGVKGTAAALVGFAPEYLGSDVNLAVDNRTMLRIYLANFIPGLPEEDAQRFITAVLANRKAHSIGYTPAEVRELKLAILSRYGARLREITTTEWGVINRFEDTQGTLMSSRLLDAAVELRGQGGRITQVRKRRGKQTVTISLTPTRYRL